MAQKITISFKETKKDLELFTYLNALEDKSTELKYILRIGIKAIEKQEQQEGNNV